MLSRVQLFETPWTVAHQAPLSLGFSRQEHWSGLSCPSLPTTDICTFVYLNVNFENRKYILIVKNFKCTWWHMFKSVPPTPFVKFYEKYYRNFDYNCIGFRDLDELVFLWYWVLLPMKRWSVSCLGFISFTRLS